MDYYDELETRDPVDREGALFESLPQFLERAGRAPAVAERLKGIVSSEIRDRAALELLYGTGARISELHQDRSALRGERVVIFHLRGS